MDIDIRPCGLSLADYARITGLDPCLFVGLGASTGCEPFKCARRKVFIGARDMAQAMIERASGVRLCDQAESLIALHPYFKKQNDFDPVEIMTWDVTGDVTYAE